MSTLDSMGRGSAGYVLSDDGRLRLRKLHEQMVFLARLAKPRTSGETVDDCPGIQVGEVALCFELAAEEIARVLERVSQMEGDAIGQDIEAEQGGSVGDDFLFGITMDQVDEINSLISLLSAHGDVMAVSGGQNLADHTVSVLGQAIFDEAQAMREIVDQVELQSLRSKVREMPAVYGVELLTGLPRRHERQKHLVH